MPKQTDSDPQLNLEHKALLSPMTLIYVPEAKILIFKCLCCNKMVAYCSDCNPVLEKTNIENSHQSHQANQFNKLPFSVITPIKPITSILEETSIKNIEKDNINATSKNTPTVEALPSQNEDFNKVDNKTDKDYKPAQNILINHSNFTEPTIDKTTNKTLENVSAETQASIIEFCYKTETKIGEINLGANYYQILELAYKASKLEIQEAYLRLLTEFNIDKIKNIPMSFPKDSLEKTIDTITNNINLAAITLLNDTLREDYDKKVLKHLASNNTNKEVLYSPIAQKENKEDFITSAKLRSKEVSINPSTQAKPITKNPTDATKINQISTINLPPKLTKKIPTIDKITANNFEKINKSPKVSNARLEIEKISVNPLMEEKIEASNLGSKNSSNFETPNNQIVFQAKPGYKAPNKLNQTIVTGYALKKDQLKHNKKEIPIAKNLYTLSLKCYETLNYERAANILQKALDLDNNNALYWNQLGKTHNKIHNSSHRAESAFKEAIKLDSENIEYLTDLAELYQNLGKNEQAAIIFQAIFQVKLKNNRPYQRITEFIQKIRYFAKNRQENSSKKRNRLKENFSPYFQSTINFVKLLFIVISYKLGKQKNK